MHLVLLALQGSGIVKPALAPQWGTLILFLDPGPHLLEELLLQALCVCHDCLGVLILLLQWQISCITLEMRKVREEPSVALKFSGNKANFTNCMHLLQVICIYDWLSRSLKSTVKNQSPRSKPEHLLPSR